MFNFLMYIRKNKTIIKISLCFIKYKRTIKHIYKCFINFSYTLTNTISKIKLNLLNKRS